MFSTHTAPGQAQADDRGVWWGYDDNEEAPYGCFVTDEYPVDKGVIHQ
jgi:hypothetical protein